MEILIALLGLLVWLILGFVGFLIECSRDRFRTFIDSIRHQMEFDNHIIYTLGGPITLITVVFMIFYDE